ncbi:sigma 54 modulation/S30EA ribosomal C-terminal domain-containing protein [Amycolatopsis rhizosphaerae]
MKKTLPPLSETQQPEVRVSLHGYMPGIDDYVRDKIGSLLRLAHRPVLAARVRLTRHGDPAVERPVVAQANLDVSGRIVRAQAEAVNPREAVDRLEERLRRRLEKIAQHWEARRGHAPSAEPHEWRHESEPRAWRAYFPRPEDEREIVRHKVYEPTSLAVDEAAHEMGLLDYDFFLFTEAGTRQDSVLYRAGETGYRLAQLTPPHDHELAPFTLPLTISRQPAPQLTTAEAVDRLNLLGLPFLFFLDVERRRGALLYHRYDGHYGLIAPSEEP